MLLKGMDLSREDSNLIHAQCQRYEELLNRLSSNKPYLAEAMPDILRFALYWGRIERVRRLLVTATQELAQAAYPACGSYLGQARLFAQDAILAGSISQVWDNSRRADTPEEEHLRMLQAQAIIYFRSHHFTKVQSILRNFDDFRRRRSSPCAGLGPLKRIRFFVQICSLVLNLQPALNPAKEAFGLARRVEAVLAENSPAEKDLRSEYFLALASIYVVSGKREEAAAVLTKAIGESLQGDAQRETEALVTLSFMLLFLKGGLPDGDLKTGLNQAFSAIRWEEADSLLPRLFAALSVADFNAALPLALEMIEQSSTMPFYAAVANAYLWCAVRSDNPEALRAFFLSILRERESDEPSQSRPKRSPFELRAFLLSELADNFIFLP